MSPSDHTKKTCKLVPDELILKSQTLVSGDTTQDIAVLYVNNDGNIQNFQCPLGASGPSPPGNMSDFLKALDFSDEALLI